MLGQIIANDFIFNQSRNDAKFGSQTDFHFS